MKDLLADAFLQEILVHPENIDVVATTNLNGDYMSEALAAQVGGIGVAPGGNINEEAGRAIFEPAHGTAPTIAGKDLANPIGMMLSGAMLFDFLGDRAAGDAVRNAVRDDARGRLRDARPRPRRTGRHGGVREPRARRHQRLTLRPARSCPGSRRPGTWRVVDVHVEPVRGVVEQIVRLLFA